MMIDYTSSLQGTCPWDLPGISERYSILIENYEKEVTLNLEKAKIDYVDEYLEILKEDPCLPNEVLPSDWQGREARKIFDEIRK